MIDNSIVTTLEGLRRPQGAAAPAGVGAGTVGTAGTWYARDLNAEVAYGDTWAEAAHTIAQARATVAQAPYYGTPNADIRPILGSNGELDYALTAAGALAVCLAAGKTDTVVHQAAIYFAGHTHLPTAALPYYQQDTGTWDTGGLALAGLLPYKSAEDAVRHLPVPAPTHTLDTWLRRHYTLSPHQMGLAAAVHAVSIHAPHPNAVAELPTAPRPAPRATPPRSAPPRSAPPRSAPARSAPAQRPAPHHRTAKAPVAVAVAAAPEPERPARKPRPSKAVGPKENELQWRRDEGLDLDGCLELLAAARLPDGTWSARVLYEGFGYSNWGNYTRIYKRVEAMAPAGMVRKATNAKGQPDWEIVNANGLRAVAANTRKHPAFEDAVARYLAAVGN